MEGAWPLCPKPKPVEALLSWLSRSAAAYGLTVHELIRIIAGEKIDASSLDLYCPPALLNILSIRAAVPLPQLHMMTLEGFVPIDVDHPSEGVTEQIYATYIKGFRVLPCVEHPGKSSVKRPGQPWVRTDSSPTLVCPKCQETEKIPYIRLTWVHGLVGCCPKHRVNLTLPRSEGERATAPTVEHCEELIALAAMTETVLHQGTMVLLNGNTITASWWLRFLRAFLDELARAEEHYKWGLQCEKTYEAIWRGTGTSPPSVASPRFTIEDGDPAYNLPFLRAAAVGISMLLRGSLTPPPHSRARLLSPNCTSSLDVSYVWDTHDLPAQ